MTYVKAAAGRGTSVIYEAEGGRREEWKGGDRNWRNQNPGNIRSNGIAWRGKIGEAGGFVVFAAPEWGLRAMRMILANRAREGKTLAQAIAHYAPSFENNTEAYVRHVVRRSGVAADAVLTSLRPEEMERVMAAMCVHEGSRVGEIVKI